MDIDKIINFLKKNQTYILSFILIFIILIPHYNLNGEYIFIGSYYTPKSAKKKKNEEELIKLTQKNTEDLKLALIESSTKYKNMEEKYNNIEQENKKLLEQIDVLTNKLHQQENFYKDDKKEKEEIKKVSFSNVSKKQIRNDRPEFGNSFSKALKKTKKN